MPIQIRKPSPDPMPEMFRQEAASRYPSREPDLFETVDGWVLRILFRKIPPSEHLRTLFLDLAMDGIKSHVPRDQTAGFYAIRIASILEDPNDRLIDRITETRAYYRIPPPIRTRRRTGAVGTKD